jgi:hypothetical protein
MAVVVMYVCMYCIDARRITRKGNYFNLTNIYISQDMS